MAPLNPDLTDADRLIEAIRAYQSALFELANVEPEGLSDEKLAQAERLAKLNQTEYLH